VNRQGETGGGAVEGACAGWTTVRRNHASVGASTVAKISRHGEIPFFSTENLLGPGDDHVRIFARILGGSSRLPDPTLSINFAESNQDTSKLTPPNFRSSGNR
jgi:hypothetical protein